MESTLGGGGGSKSGKGSGARPPTMFVQLSLVMIMITLANGHFWMVIHVFFLIYIVLYQYIEAARSP